MSRRTLFLFIALFVGIAIPVEAQPPIIRGGGGAGETLEKDSTLKAEDIRPWEIFFSEAEEEVADDSLLRWQIWPTWGDFYAYRKDAVAYRQGTIGRLDAYDIAGYSPLEQSVNLDGIDLANPITGQVNYNYVPHHKIGSLHESKYGSLHSDIRLKKYYLIKPISYLNYDEAKYNYRNLEFMVSQNFRERTNFEASFWDRRDGDSYPSNEVLGNQVVLRGYHYLNNRIQIRSLFLRNSFDLEESFGYLISNPSTFPFNIYTASPVAGNSVSSDITRRDFITGIYHRADSTRNEDAGLEVLLSKNKHRMPFSGDTLKYDLSSYQTRVFKSFTLNPIVLKVTGEWEYHDFKNNKSINTDGWNEFGVEGELEFRFIESIAFTGIAKLRTRNDGFQDVEMGGGVAFKPDKSLNLVATISAFSRMPTIQALYWNSVSFSGNPDLKNEDGISVYGEINTRLGDNFSFGGSARMKQSVNQAFIIPDSTFENGGNINVISGSVYGRFENQRFEIESSLVVHSLNSQTPTNYVNAVNNDDMKLWIRNSMFVKGYAFDRATFLKLGVRTLTSPIPYETRYFNTDIQYWQPNSLQQVPAFFRLDAELSARVRAIMVVLRMENALDGIGQAGYFETSTFPMPGRRLIVGIRAQFRN